DLVRPFLELVLDKLDVVARWNDAEAIWRPVESLAVEHRPERRIFRAESPDRRASRAKLLADLELIVRRRAVEGPDHVIRRVDIGPLDVGVERRRVKASGGIIPAGLGHRLLERPLLSLQQARVIIPVVAVGPDHQDDFLGRYEREDASSVLLVELLT